jgi:hypothetical protein
MVFGTMEEVKEEKKAKPIAPPTVITVDTPAGNSKDGDDQPKASSDAASQARTPKHANKVKDGESGKAADNEGSDPNRKKALFQGPPSHNYPPNPYPPHAFDGRMNGPPGAYQNRERHSYPPVHPGAPQAMQVSPGGSSGRYYPPYNNGPAHYSGQYHPGFQGEFPRFDQGQSYQQAPYRGPLPGFPQRQYPGSDYGSRPSWGPPPSFSNGGRMPVHPSAPSNNNNNTVSRAVSSSFDRSIKSREGNKGQSAEANTTAPNPALDDNVSDDGSWKMLRQVHSVDEEEMRKRTQREESRSEVAMHQHGSNSSSLTNSPTDGLESKKANILPDVSKLTSSLDSLSSAASAQEPMDTQNNSTDGKDKGLSPGDSTGSLVLDLMKCPSGSSNLLLPLHQRSLSQFSLPLDPSFSGKRPHEDEARGDMDTTGTDGSELRRAPSGEDRPPKKGRLELKVSKMGSPLSIKCSPPHSPSQGEKRKPGAKVHQPQPVYPPKDPHQSPRFYDHPPNYSYSMDSAPPVPQDGLARGLQRRNSSSSSATPMNVDGSDSRGPPGVSQIASWEIHAQDSFGAASNSGANGLLSSFSFPQEYPTVGGSTSIDQGPPQGQRGNEQQQHLESRNQSFDQGNYGGFGRSDSMMSYEQRHGPYEGQRQGYPPQFPPHAPSWGSNASYHSGMPGYAQQYRGSFPPMMRNYSEDSSRATPPIGPGGMRTMPPSFQPPPEFRAPPSMVSKNVPENTIMTSPYQPGPKTGPFGWTKEEDSRLSEIMKKYKNPRDWEPIAKDHNRGRA